VFSLPFGNPKAREGERKERESKGQKSEKNQPWSENKYEAARKTQQCAKTITLIQ
jgi:hypothetical protein